MRELFVYYRVRPADAAEALLRVRSLQARLMAQHSGLLARLLRRADETGGSQTWMETYAIDPGKALAGVDRELQAAIESQATALEPLLDGLRHIEAFVACAP